jgi:hypothetical protein
LGVYVQRKGGANRPAAIHPGAALTSEQAQLQAIQQRALLAQRLDKRPLPHSLRSKCDQMEAGYG